MLAKNIKLITVDVWDTCIRRSCHPDIVKIATGRHICMKYYRLLKKSDISYFELMLLRQGIEGTIARDKVKDGFDDEYQIHEVITKLCETVFIKLNDNEISRIVDNIVVNEVSIEKSYIYQDKNILAKINSISPFAPVKFISDFYMSKNTILDLLLNIGLSDKVTDGYSSCDYYYNKKSGRLFELVMKNEKLQPNEIYHIGDNFISDYKNPQKLGVNSEHYIMESNFSADYLGNRINYFISDYNELTHKLNIDNTNSDFQKYIFSTLSLLSISFIFNLLSESIKKNVEHIYFFTREGEFFYEIYSEIIKYDPFGIEKYPTASILEVSRIATFGPSVQSIDLDGFMRLWSQYSTQSLHSFLKSIGVEITNSIIQMINHVGLNVEDKIQYPWHNKQVQNLFENDDFINEISLQVKQKRNLLVGYLTQSGIYKYKNISIVDVGWRGTIQDNLALLCPDVNIEGYYLGLNKFLNEQPINCKKNGFCFDINTSSDNQRIANLVSPIEMCFNSPNGSVIGYASNRGKFCAKRKVDDLENQVFFELSKQIQISILQSVNCFVMSYKKHVIETNDFKIVALNAWKKFIYLPHYLIAKKFFKLSHNEEFGVGCFIGANDRKVSFLKIHKLKQAIVDTGWPHGYLAMFNSKFLNLILKVKYRNK